MYFLLRGNVKIQNWQKTTKKQKMFLSSQNKGFEVLWYMVKLLFGFNYLTCVCVTSGSFKCEVMKGTD